MDGPKVKPFAADFLNATQRNRFRSPHAWVLSFSRNLDFDWWSGRVPAFLERSWCPGGSIISMIIDVVDRQDGLVMIQLSDAAKIACEAAFNDFRTKHNVRSWGLLVRGSFPDETIFAQSITPSKRPSPEITIPGGSDVAGAISGLLESALADFIATETKP
jgi:hypothetical protein